MSSAPPTPDETTEESIVEERPLWEQQKEERPLHFARFQRFLHLGPSRSMLALYNADLKVDGKKPAKSVPSSWDLVAKEWMWQERAALFDTQQIKLEREAFEVEREKLWEGRRRATQERLYKLSEEILDKVEAMVKFPLIRQTIQEKYPDGREKTIIVEPANWSYGTMSTLVRGSESILRLALDIEKVRLKGVADQMSDTELIEATATIVDDHSPRQLPEASDEPD